MLKIYINNILWILYIISPIITHQFIVSGHMFQICNEKNNWVQYSGDNHKS